MISWYYRFPVLIILLLSQMTGTAQNWDRMDISGQGNYLTVINKNRIKGFEPQEQRYMVDTLGASPELNKLYVSKDRKRFRMTLTYINTGCFDTLDTYHYFPWIEEAYGILNDIPVPPGFRIKTIKSGDTVLVYRYLLKTTPRSNEYIKLPLIRKTAPFGYLCSTGECYCTSKETDHILSDTLMYISPCEPFTIESNIPPDHERNSEWYETGELAFQPYTSLYNKEEYINRVYLQPVGGYLYMQDLGVTLLPGDFQKKSIVLEQSLYNAGKIKAKLTGIKTGSKALKCTLDSKEIAPGQYYSMTLVIKPGKLNFREKETLTIPIELEYDNKLKRELKLEIYKGHL